LIKQDKFLEDNNSRLHHDLQLNHLL